MTMKITLDLGGSRTKATNGKEEIMFPSIVVDRKEGLWDTSTGAKSGIIVGDEAIPYIGSNARVYYPIQEGRLSMKIGLELAKYAIRKLNPDGELMTLNVGVPVMTNLAQRNDLRSLFIKEIPGIKGVMVWPQPLGTLIDMGLNAGIAIAIGGTTTEILSVGIGIDDNGKNMPIYLEELSTTSPIASDVAMDYIINEVTRKTGIKPDKLTAERILIGKIHHLTFGRKIFNVKTIKDDAVVDLAKQIADIINSILVDIPPVYEYLKSYMVLSGGGSILRNSQGTIKDLLEEELGVTFRTPMDVFFSNMRGLHKI